ncbi:solute carrier family 25 member 48 [Rhinolophus ferrumequinum]|uniref:Solute carrier family 25 member 48 n=1 Tax=Rhinolophus ferrumequinum TaxID=59479 RepID=A0A7J7RZF1_RHIFE|nr:solute carrier family 25 member 48 [Rhinolophus ferrumequinum]
MSFPLASIAVYNSVVFGVFSNTQRFLSQHRCREPGASAPRSLSDLLLASMVAGVVSVGLGTPVDLIKIRLQMQTQPFRQGVFQRHHCERCAGFPHERGHVPGLRALAAGHPREPRRDQPLSARLLLTAVSPEPADLRVPSFSIVSILLLTSQLESLSCRLGGTTDRSPSRSDLHWCLGKSGAKQTLPPRPLAAHWEITKELQLSLKFPNKNMENSFRSFLCQMLLPGFQETPAALILPSV